MKFSRQNDFDGPFGDTVSGAYESSEKTWAGVWSLLRSDVGMNFSRRNDVEGLPGNTVGL